MPTLSYQSPPARPLVRLWPLATGSALIAAAAVITLLTSLFGVQYLYTYHLSIAQIQFLLFFPDLATGLMILAAVALLGIALPRLTPTTGPRTLYVGCLALAATIPLIRIAVTLINALTHWFNTQPLASYLIICLSISLQLTLVIAAILYLLRLAKVLNMMPLGLLAALALSPCILCDLFFLLSFAAYAVGTLYAPAQDWPFRLRSIAHMNINSICTMIHCSLLILVWSAVSLTAAIFALSRK